MRGENVTIGELTLDGALEIVVEDGGSLEIKSLKLVNEGWEFVELSDEEQAAAAEVDAIRGFALRKLATRRVHVGSGDHIVINEGGKGSGLASRPMPTIRTGATMSSGLTPSEGAEIAAHANVKEVFLQPKGRCGGCRIC